MCLFVLQFPPFLSIKFWSSEFWCSEWALTLGRRGVLSTQLWNLWKVLPSGLNVLNWNWKTLMLFYVHHFWVHSFCILQFVKLYQGREIPIWIREPGKGRGHTEFTFYKTLCSYSINLLQSSKWPVRAAVWGAGDRCDRENSNRESLANLHPPKKSPIVKNIQLSYLLCTNA